MAKRRLDSLPDADRCTRSGKSNWRCSLPRLPGKRFCSKHHLANLSRHHPDPPSAPQSDLCEVWAFRRTPSAHPHPYHYARIDRTTPLNADVTPLLPHPSNPSPSFGLFSPSPSPTTPIPISDFTHRVFFESAAGGCYRIYPRKGEVWRLVGPTETVEVVASFREDAGAATAALLVEDGSGAFRRRTHEGCELFRRFAAEDLKAFSHRLPDARVAHTGVCVLEEEKNNTSLNCQGTAGRQSENRSMSSKESFMEGPSDNPSDNRGNASTVEAVSYAQGTDFFQGMTLSMKGSLRQQETYIMNINVSKEESVRPVENQGSIHRHTIDAIDAESVIVRETVSRQGISNCEQPVKVFGYDDIEMKRTVEQGEIWALYDESDGLPRTYARIEKFFASEGRVEVTRLEPHPTLDTEMQWVDDNLPLACGTFRASKLTCMLELSNFSHRVICDRVKATRLFYRILPCKGEIWATHKNWDRNWTHSDLKNSPEYRLVEVLSDFSEGAGVEVGDLVGVEGNEVVLQRLSSGESGLTRTLSREEFVRFSHRVPFLKVLGKRNEGRSN